MADQPSLQAEIAYSDGKKYPTYKRTRTWLWSYAVVSFILGVILLLKVAGSGWFFIALGVVYIVASTNAVQDLAAKNPRLVGQGLIGSTLVLGLLALGFSLGSILGGCS